MSLLWYKYFMTEHIPVSAPANVINPGSKRLHNADLLTLNTMRLACIAEQFITLSDETDVDLVIGQLIDLGKPTFILSGGSNVLLPPKLDVSVIKPTMKGINVLLETPEYVDIEVMAGEIWHELVVSTVNRGWFGLENLALIPGLTGAAPVQNIGAYGVQLEDCLTHVRAYHLPTQSWHEFDTNACVFGYRDSKFKREAGQWFITRVGFRLHKDSHKVKVDYGDVATLASTYANDRSTSPTKGSSVVNMTPADVMQAIIHIRQSKLPDPSQLPNCGSFFKNPVIPTQQFLALKEVYTGIVGHTVDDTHTKVAAGWLIDHAGLKGQGINPILTHAKQALVLVNHAKSSVNKPATQHDVFVTQKVIQQVIKDKYNIILEREPVWVDRVASYATVP